MILTRGNSQSHRNWENFLDPTLAVLPLAVCFLFLLLLFFSFLKRTSLIAGRYQAFPRLGQLEVDYFTSLSLASPGFPLNSGPAGTSHWIPAGSTAAQIEQAGQPDTLGQLFPVA